MNGPDRGQIDIVFDGPPGPEAGRFVEVENAQGRSISFGEWVHRPDGYWVLRVNTCTASRPLLLRFLKHALQSWYLARGMTLDPMEMIVIEDDARQQALVDAFLAEEPTC